MADQARLPAGSSRHLRTIPEGVRSPINTRSRTRAAVEAATHVSRIPLPIHPLPPVNLACDPRNSSNLQPAPSRHHTGSSHPLIRHNSRLGKRRLQVPGESNSSSCDSVPYKKVAYSRRDKHNQVPHLDYQSGSLDKQKNPSYPTSYENSLPHRNSQRPYYRPGSDPPLDPLLPLPPPPPPSTRGGRQKFPQYPGSYATIGGFSDHSRRGYRGGARGGHNVPVDFLNPQPLLHRPDQHYNVQVYPLPCPINSAVYHNNRKPNHRPGDSAAPLWNHRGRGPAHQGNRNYQASGPGGDPNNLYFHSLPPPQPRLFPPPDCPVVIPLLQPPPYPLDYQAHRNIRPPFNNPPDPSVYHHLKPGPSRSYRRGPRGGAGPIPGLGRAASGAPSNLSLLPEPEHSSSLRQPGRSRTTGSCASSSSRRSSRISKLPLAAGLGGGGAPGRPSTSGAMSGADHDGGVQVHQARGDETGRGTAVTSTMSAPLESTSSDNPSDVIQSRIQALLQSHPADPLGIQNILQRSLGVSTSPKAQQLLLGLQAVADESQQLQAVIEMCQLLVMGNEDTLVGFPIKQVVPALIQLLRMEHNFDMMNHACRALTYMMEALPRSAAVVVDAIPVFLDKLQVIQCMDVAEQSLTALEMLSRKHSKSILQARGVAACLVYLDFFSIIAQRAALAVTANCCQNITAEEFHYVSESIQLLSARLTHQDKKSVESVCLCFSRLVDNVHQDSKLLQDLATHGLLTNVQQLLVVTPSVISTPTFISVVRMLSEMCYNCPELAVQLLKQNVADTLCFLLVGTSESVRDELGLVSRSPQELYEITSLIGELMPRLPNDDIFQVDSLLMKPTGAQPELVTWYWQDDRGVWHQYTATDNRLIEAAHQAGEDDVNLTAAAGNQTYCVDFELMQQINQDSGTSRPVQRRTDPTTISSEPATDSRVGCLQEDSGLALSFIKSLFGVLYEVYSSSAGPAVRHKCLRAILRMVYFANADLLADVLKSQQVSSHIAGMLASSDLKIVVGALQLTDILMQKMADVFGVYFRREGVFYQLQRLSNPEPCQTSPGPSVVPVDNHPAAVISADNISTPSHPDTLATSHSLPTFGSSPSILAPPQSPGQLEDQSSPSQLRISDMLKRKRNVKRSGGSGRKSRSEDDGGGGGAAPYNPGFQTNRQGNNSSNNNNRNRFAGSSKSASFLASLNPSRWGRSPSNNHFVERSSSKDLVLAQSVSSCLNVNKEKVREWIRDQANKFLLDYFSTESSSPHPALSILTRLTAAIDQLNSQKDHALQALKDIVSVIIESDISPFEVIHSGLVSKLIEYTTWGDKQRHRTFLHVFMGTPLTDSPVSQPTLEAAAPLSSLVSKLNACVNQLEQFPVKVHELPGGTTGQRSGTSAIKFFNTHQLKCNLQRHPNCTNLRNWKGGTVKIDPLALVQAIEKYLVIRGYGRVRDEDETGSEGDNSDSDIDDTLAAVMLSQGSARHRLQLMIGEHVLPYNMTVYQAVRQYGSPDGQETDGEGEGGLGQSSIWLQTHSIWYRALSESEANSLPPSIPHCRASSVDSSVVSGQITSSRKSGKSAVVKSSPRKRDDLWNEGVVPQPQSPLLPLLTSTLPDTVCVQDASLETLCLLRHLHAFNRYWGSLYDVSCYSPVLSASEFLNSKLTAKANRQLQDPLVIMTGNLPTWLSQVALACPFLFPFETRQMLLYTVSFDRDRALQRLLDSAPELAGHDSTERVTPRMERRKRTVNRDDLLKQAETVIHDLGSSKALLEIQYQNEVGTGLGPTLEFYSLVSKELQRADLELWRGEIVKVPGGKDGSTTDHVFSSAGLYPAPLPRNAKVNQVTKVKSKFKFLGKLMAKAVMDSRMLDLPLSPVFYHWLLARESNLTSVHLQFVNMDIAKTIYKLEEVVREKGRIQAEEGQTAARLKAALDDLTMDGSRIEDLSLDFTLPGYQGVELRKGGKDLGVGVNNVEEYVKLVVHWSLIEGVQRQMESFREGFDSVFPLAQLQVFYPEELEQVFCGAGNQTWDVKVLMECCRPDHGYTHDSKAIKFLFEILSGYNGEEQRSFVHFITGSPRLPVGGLRSLNPPLTIVRKTFDPTDNPDDFLPSVMTCVNYLKLPDYSSVDKMKERLRTAALEGQQAFHLS